MSEPVTTIKFRVPAVPVAQPRARVATVGGRAKVYEVTKHPVAAFKATVRLAFETVYQGEPLQGPLRCDISFIMPRPQAMIWKKRPMPRVPHDKKPDRDNLDKSVMDALKGLAWNDDAQVAQGFLAKWIAAGDEQPHVTIVIVKL